MSFLPGNSNFRVFRQKSSVVQIKFFLPLNMIFCKNNVESEAFKQTKITYKFVKLQLLFGALWFGKGHFTPEYN